MLSIDGSMGEGGGQILRSALALSMVTGTPFRIDRIRANRDKPGLRRQHLAAVNAAAQICGAKVGGAAVNSTSLSFLPGKIKAGEYHFSIGSAGSTTLVVQAVLPALLTLAEPTTIHLEGGTHNPFAPPVDFLAKAFVPLINRMGPGVKVTLERPGFAPAGGGRLRVDVQPVSKLNRLDLPERGAIVHCMATATLAGLPAHIAERELSAVEDRTGWGRWCFQTTALPPEFGPGNVLMIEIASEHVTEVFTGFGMRGVRAESVGESTVESARRYLAADVPVGDCLADQLLLPLALAGGGSFRTLPLTKHFLTNIEVIRLFLNVQLDAVVERSVRVELKTGA